MFESGLTLAAFLAGLLTFFAPCTFPLVPAFLGIVAGTAAENERRQVIKRAVGFVLGFSLVFIAFGVAFSFLGSIYGIRRWLQAIGGGFIIIIGLMVMGWLPALKIASSGLVNQKFGQVLRTWGTFGAGMLFALGWSPCVGPLLGSILFLASGSGTVAEGVFLLAVFLAGLAAPFLILAVFLNKGLAVLGRLSGAVRSFNTIVGVFLVVLGMLLVSGHFILFLNKFRVFIERIPFYEEYINRFL